MPIEKYTCSLHDDETLIFEDAAVHVHGHPGITEWGGTLGPVEVELEIGKTYRIKVTDERGSRDGLVIVQRQMKAWGGASGHRYEFEGVGGLD
jgi:hypothetical protein